MNPSDVKKHLIDVLSKVQAISGETCPDLHGSIKPVDSLPKFNSKIWPVAAGMLSAAVGENLPPEANIFVNGITKQALTIDETVALVCFLIEQQKKVPSVAAA